MPILTNSNYSDLSRLANGNAAQDTDPVRRAIADRTRLKKATQEFEAVFLGQMLKQMRKSLTEQNALFDTSQESKQYREMMDDVLADRLSQSGGIGLAKTLYKTMAKALPPDPREIALKLQMRTF